jgi:hypothetical protein
VERLLVCGDRAGQAAPTGHQRHRRDQVTRATVGMGELGSGTTIPRPGRAGAWTFRPTEPAPAVVVRDIHAVAGDRSDTEHDAFHGSHGRRSG